MFSLIMPDIFRKSAILALMKARKTIKICMAASAGGYMTQLLKLTEGWGHEVFSVPICEVKNRHSDIVAVAETKEQFCRAIENELNSDTEQRKHLRIETARRHDWNNHILRLSNIITDALSNNPHLN